MKLKNFYNQIDNYEFDFIEAFKQHVNSGELDLHELNRLESYSLWALTIHNLPFNDERSFALYHASNGPIYTRVIQLQRISAEMFNPQADLEAITHEMTRIVHMNDSDFWNSTTAEIAVGITLAHMFRRGIGVHDLYQKILKSQNATKNFLQHITGPTVPLHKNGKFLNQFFERYSFSSQYQRFMLEPLYDIPHSKYLLDNIKPCHANLDLVAELASATEEAVFQSMYADFQEQLKSIFKPSSFDF